MRNSYYIKGEQLIYEQDRHLLSSSIQQNFAEISALTYVNRLEDEIQIPVSVFSGDLAPLQSLVKFLREQEHKTNAEISKLIGRDGKTVWLTYQACKGVTLPESQRGTIFAPVSIFASGNASILEALIAYLNESGLTFSQIARLVNRDPRTIWTCFARHKKKQGVTA